MRPPSIALALVLAAGCSGSGGGASAPVASTASPAASSVRDPEQLPDGSLAGVPCAGEQVDELGLAGLSEREARERAGAAGRPVRVECLDGRAVPVTLDLRPERIGIGLRDGVVVSSHAG